MLVTNREILRAAQRGFYAVGAFNIQNLESLLAVVEAAAEEKSPVIVAVAPSAIKYSGIKHLSRPVRGAAEDLPGPPVSLHLDHGEDVEIVEKCIEAGFTSVMIDSSHMPFEGNVALTRRVVEIAHSKNVSVEGELGRLTGMEEKTIEKREPNATIHSALNTYAWGRKTIKQRPDRIKEVNKEIEAFGVKVLQQFVVQVLMIL